MSPKKLHFFRAIGVLLVISSALAVFKFRPRDIPIATLTSQPPLIGLNAWQLRWKFGWERSRSYPVISGAPAPVLAWSTENGGTLTAGLNADNSGCVVFKAVIPQGQGQPDLVLQDTVSDHVAKANAKTDAGAATSK